MGEIGQRAENNTTRQGYRVTSDQDQSGSLGDRNTNKVNDHGTTPMKKNNEHGTEESQVRELDCGTECDDQFIDQQKQMGDKLPRLISP